MNKSIKKIWSWVTSGKDPSFSDQQQIWCRKTKDRDPPFSDPRQIWSRMSIEQDPSFSAIQPQTKATSSYGILYHTKTLQINSDRPSFISDSN